MHMLEEKVTNRSNKMIPRHEKDRFSLVGTRMRARRSNVNEKEKHVERRGT